MVLRFLIVERREVEREHERGRWMERDSGNEMQGMGEEKMRRDELRKI